MAKAKNVETESKVGAVQISTAYGMDFGTKKTGITSIQVTKEYDGGEAEALTVAQAAEVEKIFSKLTEDGITLVARLKEVVEEESKEEEADAAKGKGSKKPETEEPETEESEAEEFGDVSHGE